MKTVGSQVRGDLIIKEDTQYNDVLAENVTVNENITTRIYGTIKKNLEVKKGATTYLHGKVLGEIVNNGGIIYVFGPAGDIKTY